ncbi:MAG: type V CRISPR-associated protein Cas12b, partial [Pseudomonadota bacterium]
MPTRTVTLKMILGKRDETAEIRRALWTTHKEINNAVEQIQRTLLLCRGASYRTVGPDGLEVEVPEGDVVEGALNMARRAQKRNGKAGTAGDEEVLVALRQLYEKLVPSCIDGEKGDAQASNAWVSPLMDPESEGGLSVIDKVIDPPPKWIEMRNAEESGWEKASEEWSRTEECRRLQSVPGRKPGWITRLNSGQPWQAAFIQDQDKKRKEVQGGSASFIKQMKDRGLLPLMRPTIRRLLSPESSGVAVWDRLAMRLAVAHLLSWESWNHSTKKAHDEAKEKVATLREQYKEYDEQFKNLREYEAGRHAELKQVAFADDENPFRIGPRGIRAWERVREEWSRKGDSYEARRKILTDLQTKLRGKFGDPDQFLWLAEDGREHLWQDADILTPLVKLNVAERILTKRKPYALMTFAEERLHPRWVMFEAPGGSNLRNYKLEERNGEILLSLPLLLEDGIGGVSEKEYTMRLAPSGQVSHVRIVPMEFRSNGSTKRVTFVTYRSSHQEFESLLKG